MLTAIKSTLTHEESLPTSDSVRTGSSLKSSFSTVSSTLPDILSSAVVHKRRPQKRVRFALKLEPVEEDSLPVSREISSISEPKSPTRITDPWRPDGPLYGTYIEYLEKLDISSDDETNNIHRSPPPPPPPAPEPGAEPPTYTHTFVIQSKSPEIVINSITVSTPSLHLPRIAPHTKKNNKKPLPTMDSYVKQQLTLSTPPRLIHRKKLSHSASEKGPYVSVHAALKRAELNIPATNGLHPNNKILRSDHSSAHEHISTKKMTEIITKPLPGVNNQINHFSDQSVLPNYTKKARMHNRLHRTNEQSNVNTRYFLKTHDNDYLLRPIIHFSP